MSDRISAEPARAICGFRPTGDLTIANYLGAVRPLLDLQQDERTDLYLFAADVNGLIDQPPNDVLHYRSEIIRDCLALGVDATRTHVYLQSDIEPEVSQIYSRLGVFAVTNNLLNTPNVLAKMQKAVYRGEADSDDPRGASFSLLGYPVLMAADIFAQSAEIVAVGPDQDPHIEIAQSIARAFNDRYGATLIEPVAHSLSRPNVIRLNGEGKMSKTNRQQAIMLTDTGSEAREKIDSATTASPGDWNETISSHFLVARSMTSDPSVHEELDRLRCAHMAGNDVEDDFKQVWGEVASRFLDSYHARRADITDAVLSEVLDRGKEVAGENAQEAVSRIKKATGM